VLLSLCLALSLTSCAAPAVRVQYINVPTFVPVPVTLVAPVSVSLPVGITYGEALGSLRAGLTSCNADKAAIATLKPPPAL